MTERSQVTEYVADLRLRYVTTASDPLEAVEKVIDAVDKHAVGEPLNVAVEVYVNDEKEDEDGNDERG